jgi:DNA gyrase inhibitor GyrI
VDFIIEQIPAQPILFMRRIGAYGIENYTLMSQMKEWANLKGLFQDSTIYGIAQDNPINTPPDQCRYDVCLIATVDFPEDDSIQKGEIPSGRYAIFTIPHTTEAVQEFWGSVSQELQERGLHLDTIKPILERYKYRLVEDGKCEFCVPII